MTDVESAGTNINANHETTIASITKKAMLDSSILKYARSKLQMNDVDSSTLLGSPSNLSHNSIVDQMKTFLQTPLRFFYAVSILLYFVGSIILAFSFVCLYQVVKNLKSVKSHQLWQHETALKLLQRLRRTCPDKRHVAHHNENGSPNLSSVPTSQAFGRGRLLQSILASRLARNECSTSEADSSIRVLSNESVPPPSSVSSVSSSTSSSRPCKSSTPHQYADADTDSLCENHLSKKNFYLKKNDPFFKLFITFKSSKVRSKKVTISVSLSRSAKNQAPSQMFFGKKCTYMSVSIIKIKYCKIVN